MENPDLKREDEIPEEPSKRLLDTSKLSDKNRLRLKNKEVTTEQILAENNAEKAKAEDQLNKHLTIDFRSEQAMLTNEEYLHYQKRLSDAEDFELQDILDEIEGIPEKKAKESEVMSPESTEIKSRIDKYKNLCKKHERQLGKIPYQKYIDWIDTEAKKEPTIKKMDELFKNLNSNDKNGIHVRIKEFNKCEKLCLKYGLRVEDCPELATQGMHKREKIRASVEKLDDHFEGEKDTGFYSKEMIKDTMQQALKTNDPNVNERVHDKADQIARKEAESFTYLNSEMKVGGVTVKKMSDKSKKLYLDYYKNTDFKEREGLVNKWKELVEKEAELSTKLGQIYKDHPDLLRAAVKGFAKLDFMAKQKDLDKQKKDLEGTENKEELREKLLHKAIDKDIDEATTEKVFSKKTQKRYKEFFHDVKNYKKEGTEKTPDLDKLEKMHDSLMSKTPNEKARNKAFYKQHRNHYYKHITELQTINPDIKEKDINKWKNDFDNEGYKSRESIHQKLETEITEQKIEQQKKRNEETAGGITEAEKKEAKERTPEQLKLIADANDALAEDTKESITDAWKKIFLAINTNEELENDKGMLYLLEQLTRRKRELGTDTVKKSKEQEITSAVEQVSHTDTVSRELEEIELKKMNLEATEQSQRRHNVISMKDRAKKESLEGAAGNQDEQDIIEEYYDASEDTEILSADTETGEEAEVIKINDIRMEKGEQESLKQKTREHQTRIIQDQGFTHVKMVDEKGEEKDARELMRSQEKKEEKKDENILQQVQEKLESKNDAANDNSEFFDIQSKHQAERELRRQKALKRQEIQKG
ncbi:hypothetical protein JKY72_06365 [Candidatus Gracilibacteria bacterium]|nr:hypothetical protein [Candidatus Gracilibacteria bacterium]